MVAGDGRAVDEEVALGVVERPAAQGAGQRGDVGTGGGGGAEGVGEAAVRVPDQLGDQLVAAGAPGGTLVSYGSASTRDDEGSKQWPVLKLLLRVWLWNALPNRRRAYFFNIWAGRALAKNAFRARLRADLTQVFAALRRGDVTARIAAELPLARVAGAMRLAESGTVAGKVVLTP
ncbi:zinc-binding dehydrogenase [Nonomuraea rhodomycinica]|uniref:zinc-binding dehydrogenase n=1 Tax=Nonomuraea rhodomycinica TaxID=1712872 RepID=UPI001C378595|nr:zinc-binding dehydrogenase [Nonomuraea rhodomycinica]